jgi:hypothetical protein
MDSGPINRHVRPVVNRGYVVSAISILAVQTMEQGPSIMMPTDRHLGPQVVRLVHCL